MSKLLYNRKSYWMKRLTKAEIQVTDILNRAYRHDKLLRPRHIGAINARLNRLGDYGENLYKKMCDHGAMSEESLAKMGDALDDIQDLSQGLVAAARKILGFEMRSLRPYMNTIAFGTRRVMDLPIHNNPVDTGEKMEENPLPEDDEDGQED